ncbi:hypothetical protein BC833DRAFT_654233 [Globomyces pollinis-pini]|nr:hypothetical protein BC833DRAFT_654233 [Globomyces pollinis-pini]
MQERLVGRVKFFSSLKGFGFIMLVNEMENGRVEVLEDCEDVFVHFTEIVSTASVKYLNHGMMVQFTLTRGLAPSVSLPKTDLQYTALHYLS